MMILIDHMGKDFKGYYLGADLSSAELCEFPHNGFSVRFHIPFKEAKVEKVVLNGQKLAISDYEGYLLWRKRNFTIIQINIPPKKKYDVLVLSVKYEM